MTEKIVIGLIINCIWLIHLFRANDSAPLVKLFAFFILLIPYLGFVIYLIMFLMPYPSPQPKNLRQNRMNHYGRTAFGEKGDFEYKHESSKEYFPPIKSETRRKKLKHKELPLVYKLAAFFVGTYIASLGVISIKLGTWSYSNWWGGAVFAPCAIVYGGFFIYMVLIKPGK